MNYIKFFCLFLFFTLLKSNYSLVAQVTTTVAREDTTKKVHILSNTRTLIFQTIDDSTKLTIVSGDVKLRQGNALLYCDSCVINSRTNMLEAWGKVHIIDSDTAHITSNHLRYLGNTKLAYLDGNVKMTDGKAVLTTPDLEYDMETNIGTYKNGGKVINKKSVLTSKEGYYFADLKDVYFKKNVLLKDPAYTIDTDSLLYNTTTQQTKFISPTIIKDSSGRIIKTREGFYNQQTGKAEFGSRPEIIDGKTSIRANRVAFDDSTGVYQAEGNAIIIDTAQGTTIIGGLIYQNRKTEAVLATQKPLMIIRQENDSIYITADTLFSARLTDKFGRASLRIDTIKRTEDSLINAKDSIQNILTDSLLTQRLSDSTRKIDSVLTDTAIEKKVAVNEIDSSWNLPTDTLLAQRPIGKLEKKDSLVIDTAGKTKLVKINEKDSARNIAMDTLLSRRPPDQLERKDSLVIDTLKGTTAIAINEKDSTNRYFEAYRNVRIFSDSLQSVCDSMFYSFKDSVFRLYKDPVVWAQNSQITGDTILLFTKNKKADKVEAFENSFLVNRLENDVYNQIKSARMDGWFVDGNIDSVRAKAFAECIYYIQDDDSAYTGINQSQCDIIDIYFENKELDKVVFRSAVTGTLWPIRQKSPQEMQLPGFRWLEERRPKTKYEMFE
ncbi:MAG TPA: OstA-like protein [Chitinophagaceae bacterium]|nr:OstA-like protein [Chitinophagaceae bacterium]